MHALGHIRFCYDFSFVQCDRVDKYMSFTTTTSMHEKTTNFELQLHQSFFREDFRCSSRNRVFISELDIK
jgi:hypothetical protein